ncbi:MAG: hypothetical protein WDN25_11330 [Acetobacteraceae bacterium]
MLLAELLYLIAIGLFGYVVVCAAQLPSGVWLVLSLFPVFIAIILGFVMWAYAWYEFAWPVTVFSLLLPLAVALPTRRLSTRNLFIATWAAAVLGLITARLAFLAAGIG